jgi:hypothetical protein
MINFGGIFMAPFRGYIASDATLNIYRFDIPAAPVSGGSGRCPNIVFRNRLKDSGTAPFWSTSGQDPEGLTTRYRLNSTGQVIDQNVGVIDENDGAVLGRFSPNLNTDTTIPVNIVKGNTQDRFGTESALGYSRTTQQFYAIGSDDTSPAAVRGSALYRFGNPTAPTSFGPLTKIGGGAFNVRGSANYIDGLGINVNNLALGTSARNISTTNPPGVYNVNLTTGAITLRTSVPALNLSQDTGADFAPGQANILYIFAEKGGLYRYTISGTSGTTVKLCQVPTATLSGGGRTESANSDFEGFAVVDDGRPSITVASESPAGATQTVAAGLNVLGDFSLLTAPLVFGIVTTRWAKKLRK